jgi:glycosyltransferase involved in cell wall biosynthesis
MSREALRLDRTVLDAGSYHVLMMEKVLQEAGEYDIIHSHIDYPPFPLYRRFKTPTITTLHGRLDLPDLPPLYREYTDIAIVSISNAQRTPLSWANWLATVYHGLPEDLYAYYPDPGKYLVFLGRVSPEKRVDSAIEIALKTGIPLKIAAKVDRVDEEYFKTVIKPMLNHPLIEFIGEVGEKEKGELLGNALALLFPIDWPEPFGLVMTEAMACGTPVIARNRGSVPEVMTEGVTGFIIEDVEGAVAAVKKLHTISRRACRETFEARFSSRCMAHNYLRLYQQLIDQKKHQFETIEK